MAINKSLATNGLAAAVVAAGISSDSALLTSTGMFALSGALTNWLAVHMLFEKVPFLYGSGVIPERFESFKQGIKQLIMEQFFTRDNIDRFLRGEDGKGRDLHLAPVLERIDFSPMFDGLVEVIEGSQFGSVLAMAGGAAVLEPMRDKFVAKIKQSIEDLTQTEQFNQLLREELEQPQVVAEMAEKIEVIVEQRLQELTPALVKEIVQQMIREHLGWLVVWGGVFGGAIGAVMGLIG